MIKTQCTCGFIVETETVEEGYKIAHQHFLDNLDTHSTGRIAGGLHFHMPAKKKWYQKVWKMLKDNRFLV